MSHELSRTTALTGARRAFTLVELVLVVTLTGLVLGIVTVVGVRLRRQLADAMGQIERREQLSSAAAILPLDLRGLSPAAGDIRPGEARDTSLVMRVLIATAAACGGSANTALLVPLLAAGGRRVVLSIQPGDTLWFLADGDAVEGWRPNPIRGVHQISGTCGQLAADAGRTVFDPERLLSVDLRDTVGDVKSSLVRLTRPIRYSIYRAGDGLWYLGLQTWSPASMQFNTVQPLSGPYEPPGPSATRIEYFDTSGNVLAPGTPNTRDIARIEWMLRSRSPAGALTPGDSTRIVVAMRNRR